MKNIFQAISSSFGKEDFFTASLAYIIDNVERVRLKYLEWLEECCAEKGLVDISWEVKTHHHSPSRYGDAYLDFKLVSPSLELWFEHKLDSPMGKTEKNEETIDQLTKYLDAASRKMQGIDNEAIDVTWPKDGPVANRPRVILFYITKKSSKAIKSKYDDKLHSPGKYGLVWPENGSLQWHQCWSFIKDTLQLVSEQSDASITSEVVRMFNEYWKDIPEMAVLFDPNADWNKLLTIRESNKRGFYILWSDLIDYLRQFGVSASILMDRSSS